MRAEENKLENLTKLIEEVRCILNGISFDYECNEQRLIVSQCLDQLIVEYLKSNKHMK